MFKQHNKKGLSLTELLVASFLVGIVMLGMVGFNVAITTMEGTSQGAATGAVHAASSSAALRRDIENAIGDLNNPGILTSGNRIALRRENESAPDPANYGNDDWICWTVDANNVLRRSINPTSLSGQANPTAPINVNECLQGGVQISFMSTSNPNFFQIQRDAQNRIQYIEITLTSRPDVSTGSTADALSNPETTYRTHISPIMLSE